MQIKKLKLHGFKSFPDKTEIDLDAPITALVGPNGCGKSNVVDAIKWVLGSQSPTSLRGDEMSDVIFKGSANRNQIGFAKAEFVLDNSDGEIPLDYSEVSIGRKLYRSGESQYLINGEEVRLKDINELLYDTGIGVENYSLIEQGRIDRVLSSSAKERRELIEEAAGISTFQARKRESQRKLDRVQEDLDRVQDVLNELKNDIHALKTQAGKAKKYKEHKQKLEEKKLLLHVNQYRELVEKEEQLHEEWQETKQKREEVQQKMKSARNNEEELTQNLNKLQDQIGTLQNDQNDLEKNLLEINNSIESFKDKLQNTNEEYDRLSEKNLEELAERIEEIADEIQEVKRKRSQKQEELNEIDQRKRELDQQVEKHQNKLSEHREEKKSLQKEQSQLLENKEDIKRKRHNIQDRRERIQDEVKEYNNKKKKVSDKLATYREDLSTIKDEISQKEQSIQTRQGSLAILRRAKQKKHSEYLTVHQELEETKEEHQKITSRIQFLQTLEEKQSGLSDATKSVLNRFDPDDDDNGVLGLLGSKIQFTELGHRTIQGLLDPFLQFVVVEDWTTAEQIIESVTDADGHVGVLVKSALSGSRSPDEVKQSIQTSVKQTSLHQLTTLSSANSSAGTLNTSRRDANPEPPQSSSKKRVPMVFNGHKKNPFTFLHQYLQTDPPYQSFLTQLLASFGFDRTNRSTNRPSDLFPPSSSSASVRNIISSKQGLVFTRGESSVEENVVDRRRTLEQLQEQESTISEQLNTLQQRDRQLSDGLEKLDKAIDSLSSQVYETEINLENKRERVSWLSQQIDEQQTEKEEIENSISELRTEDEQLNQNLQDLESRIKKIQQQETSLNQSIQEVNTKIESVESDLEDVRDSKQHLNVQKAQLDEKIQSLDERLQRHKNDREQARERIESVRNRMSELEERREQLNQSLEEKRAEKKSCENDLEELKEKISTIRDREESIKKRQKEKEEKRKEIVEAYNEFQEQSQELKIKLKEAESNRKNLEERAQDQIDRDFEKAVEEYDVPSEDIDRDQLKEEVDELESTLNRMGNVNLAAVDQLEEKQERAEDIEEQEEDLKKSRRKLQRIIRKMKKESHKRFKEAFEEGKENFNDLFRKLFGGGKATLKAVFDEEEEEEDEEDSSSGNSKSNGKAGSKDLLECGIEIHAQPPGKDMTNMSLLSGGERAMTSIALMMALFMLNPSAICILDEADAPLDESNLDLFIGLLNEFTDLTQFLVITHKKKTIAAADRVYGLTMQEDGVSELISMDMEKRIPEEYLQENPEEQPGSVAGTAALT